MTTGDEPGLGGQPREDNSPGLPHLWKQARQITPYTGEFDARARQASRRQGVTCPIPEWALWRYAQVIWPEIGAYTRVDYVRGDVTEIYLPDPNTDDSTVRAHEEGHTDVWHPQLIIRFARYAIRYEDQQHLLTLAYSPEYDNLFVGYLGKVE